jgi:N-acetylglucosamine-6-phosphate deacetylase
MASVRGRSVEDGKPIVVHMENGRISRIVQEKADPAEQLPYLTAGIIDLQVNGYRGRGYSLEDFDHEQLVELVGFLAASGTAQQIATVVTSPHDRIVGNLEIISRACRENDDIAAAIPGIHLEGPFISSADGPRGAHDASFVRDPNLSEFSEWQEAAEGRIVMVTLAPERRGAIEFIEELGARQVVAAIGHTAADPETIRRAVAAGASYSTHLGNGSSAMIPRHENNIWEQLAADELYMGLIPDGFHLPPAALKSLSRAKGYDKTVLVSDVARMGGLAPGDYSWGTIGVRVHEDGHLNVVGTPFLAGAGHLLDWSIARFIDATGCSIADAIAMCTKNPAAVIGLESGTLDVGSPAHLTLFDYSKDNEKLGIRSVWRCGAEVFSGHAAG